MYYVRWERYNLFDIMFNINIKHKKYSFPLWQNCHQCKIFIIDTWSAHLEGMMDEEIIEKKEHRKHLSPFNPRVHPLVADSTLFAPSVKHIPDKNGISKFFSARLILWTAYLGSPTLSSGLQMQSPDNLKRKTESENILMYTCILCFIDGNDYENCSSSLRRHYDGKSI